jgi:hypothetical protein
VTVDVFEQTLNEFAARRPFHPFTIDLANGRRLEVDHARALAYRGGSVAVFIAPGNVPVIFDHDGVASIVAVPANVWP